MKFPRNVIDQFAWRVLGVHRTDIEGDTVVLHNGLFTTRKICASEIASWTIHPEMGMDIIDIRLTDGSILRRIDKYNDLIAALRLLAQDKEISSNSDHKRECC